MNETFGMRMSRNKKESAMVKRGWMCPKCRCSNNAIRVRDGSKLGLLPGVQYADCPACGHEWGVTP